jgi:dTDP-4-dehydrorhamnose reductase
MKILITGARGLLGQALKVSLRHHELRLCSHRDLDISDQGSVLKMMDAISPEMVINTAGFNDVGAAETRVAEAWCVNALGPHNLAVATARAGIPIMHFSTDCVFDGTLGRPYTEDDKPHPISIFGASKLEGEIAVADANPRHYIVRTAWLFHETGENFLNLMLEEAVARRKLHLVDRFSSPTYVTHLARAVADIIETRDFGVRHLAGGGTASCFEMVELAMKGLGVEARLERIPQSESPSRARRPEFTPLMSIREPRIELPPWQIGMADFIAASRFYGRSLAAAQLKRRVCSDQRNSREPLVLEANSGSSVVRPGSV